MNVSFISCANTSCGIGRYTDHLAKAISQKGHSVKGWRKSEADESIFTAYPHRSFKNLRHYIAPYYLHQVIKNESPDIIQADYVDAAFAVRGKQLRTSKLFTTIHDAIPFRFPTSGAAFTYYKMQLKYAADHSEKLIVVSEQSKKDILEFTNIAEDKIEVVYNGIDHSWLRPVPVTTQKDTPFLIRYHGGLGGPYKNVSSLLYMAQALEVEGYEFRLEIAGGHPENTPLPQIVEQLGIKSVRFAGFVPDVQLPTFLSEADLFVYPSRYEGFGFPPLEAMACGTPVVSSGAGSLSEVLGDAAITTGSTAEELTFAVKKVMDSPELLARLQRAARPKALEYTWEKTAQNMLNLYQQAI